MKLLILNEIVKRKDSKLQYDLNFKEKDTT